MMLEMKEDVKYETNDPRRYNPEFQTSGTNDPSFEDVVTLLKRIKSHHNDAVSQARHDGYKEGFATGFEKAFHLLHSEIDVNNIDWESIKIFSGWCYVNGIDFSYMAKGTDTEPFTERVMNKFKEYLDERLERKYE